MRQVVRCGTGLFVFEGRGEFAFHVIGVGDPVWVESFEGAGVLSARCLIVTEVKAEGWPSGGLPRVVGLCVV